MKTSVLVGLLCLIWGSTWLVIREGLKDLPVFSSLATRFFIAWVLMVVVAAIWSRKEGGSRPTLGLVLVAGLLNFAASYGVVYWAEQYLPSALSSILWGVFPLMMAVFSHLFLTNEQLTIKHAAGFLLGFAGVVFLFVFDVGELGRELEPMAPRAAWILLLSPLVVAISTTIIKKYGAQVSSLKLNRDGLLIATVIVSVVALTLERDEPFNLTGRAIFSLAYLSVVGTVVTFGTYFWLLRHAPAYKLAVIPYVSPVVAVVLGYFIASENIGISTLAGMGLILLGVMLVVGREWED